MVEFVNEMSPLETMNKNQKKDKARKKEDLPTGNPLEPSYVYKTLLQLESETFKVSSSLRSLSNELFFNYGPLSGD